MSLNRPDPDWHSTQSAIATLSTAKVLPQAVSHQGVPHTCCSRAVSLDSDLPSCCSASWMT